ncbi:MAG: 3'-5' exoribonuclease YhaM family protein [Luteolibacter sp.]
MTPLSIAALRQSAGETPIAALVLAQLQAKVAKVTKNNKPYLELVFADCTGNFSLKVWSDSAAYHAVESLQEGVVLCLDGHWTLNQYGLDARDLDMSRADDSACEEFFSGDPELREKQDRDYATIKQVCGTIKDPRLLALCEAFFDQFGENFRRTAAAKKNHHARRGGLVEHVAQMLRSAEALSGVYPQLNRDLLIAGVLFHDSGKLWENSYPKQGFAQKLNVVGEMMGHIPMGIELVNKLWHEISESEEVGGWEELKPRSDEVRLHLLHLIGSHHGTHEFGSPVLPRTPEAFALHFIDNLDAKMEMVMDAYSQQPEVAPGIYERMFPLPANLIKPLSKFEG